jgi:hypothetical protein
MGCYVHGEVNAENNTAAFITNDMQRDTLKGQNYNLIIAHLSEPWTAQYYT